MLLLNDISHLLRRTMTVIFISYSGCTEKVSPSAKKCVTFILEILKISQEF